MDTDKNAPAKHTMSWPLPLPAFLLLEEAHDLASLKLCQIVWSP